MQDISAMALLTQGEKPNTFLDIGCRDPKEGSNSLLLEQNGWQGLCVDIDDHCQAFEEKRKTPFFKSILQVRSLLAFYLDISLKDT